MSSTRLHLLAIDPQNDFCDLPAQPDATLRPALPVAGADADMHRLAGLVDALGERLGEITVTLDSHHRLDIAHPTFWCTGEGAAVPPFTAITAQQVREGDYRPRQAAHRARALAYLDALEARGRYTLMVWPVHCEIGSWGHNVHGALRAAYNRWEDAHGRSVAKVTKGENPWTEHYSAVQAEVPDEADAHTQINAGLLQRLAPADCILIGGEASSHCVKATTEHLVAHLGGPMDRLVLLTDCMSPVAGCEALQAAFFADMHARGVRLMTSAQALAL